MLTVTWTSETLAAPESHHWCSFCEMLRSRQMGTNASCASLSGSATLKITGLLCRHTRQTIEHSNSM